MCSILAAPTLASKRGSTASYTHAIWRLLCCRPPPDVPCSVVLTVLVGAVLAACSSDLPGSPERAPDSVDGARAYGILHSGGGPGAVQRIEEILAERDPAALEAFRTERRDLHEQDDPDRLEGAGICLDGVGDSRDGTSTAWDDCWDEPATVYGWTWVTESSWMPEGMQVTAFTEATWPGPIRHYIQADLYFFDGSEQVPIHSYPEFVDQSERWFGEWPTELVVSCGGFPEPDPDSWYFIDAMTDHEWTHPSGSPTAFDFSMGGGECPDEGGGDPV